MSLGRLPVKVHVRLRPVAPSLQNDACGEGTHNPAKGFIEVKGTLLQLHDVAKQHTSQFSFDNVFASDTIQAQLHEAIGEPLVEHVLSGYNACCFAYGQTGSGKTYSMVGQDDVKGDRLGLAPRCLESMFKAIETMAKGGNTVTTHVSFIEIYQENVRDLGKAASRLQDKDKNYGSSQALGSMPRPPSATMSAAADRKVIEELSRESLDIMDDPCQGTQIRNLHQTKVHSSADAIAILLAGTRIRATAATVQNDVSSRSHTVFTVTTLIASSSSSEPDLTGKLNLVDLAGSESLKKSGEASEERLAEARCINSSLSALGKVVMELSTGGASTASSARHVPFRDSKLTRVLKDSLTGNSCTHLLACLHPQPANLRECHATLQFAIRCTNIHTAPVVNTVVPPGADAEQAAMIARLNGELQRLQQELDQTHAHYQKLLDDDEGSCSSVGGGESSGALLPVAVGGRHESTPAPPGTAASGLSGSKATSAAPASGGPLPTAGVVAGGLPAGGSAVNKGWLQRAVSRQSSASRSGRSRQTAAMAAELATATERAQKFESQLEHTRLLLAEMRAEHASLRQQHAELLNHSMQDAADAKAARLRARDTVCDLRAQVASAQADVRHGRAAAGEAAADGAVRLQHDVDHLQRHNTELLRAVPDALRVKTQLASELSGELRTREAALQERYEFRAAAAEETARQRVEEVEARASAAEQQLHDELQAARREARLARNDAVALDEAWRKEAVVLWEYADKLAAAWDRRRVELRRSPGASGPSVCPGFGQALRNTRTASAAAAGHACGAALIVSSSVSRDPAWKGGRRMSSPPANRARAGSLNPTDRQIAAVATPCALEEETAAIGTCRSGWPPRGAAERPLPGPLDARGLSQVLGAVNAVETYLYCTGRMKHLPESAPAVAADVREGSGDGRGAQDVRPAAGLPGWRLALAKLQCEAVSAVEEIATLRAERDQLAAERDTLRLEQRAVPPACSGTADSGYKASKDPEPENELQQARAAAQRAQRHAESLQAALASSHRMLARSGSHAVTPMAARPISPARPSSAPLPRPATAFALTGPRSRGPPGGAGRLQVALSPRDRPPWRTVEVRDAAAERPRPRPFSAVQCPGTRELGTGLAAWGGRPIHGHLNRHAFLSPGDFVSTPEAAKRRNRQRPASARPATAGRTPGSSHHWS